MAALLLQWWTNAVDYPFLVSGKPLFSLPANIPVIFEVIILFAALAAFFGMLGANRLPQLANRLLRDKRFLSATNDQFFLLVADVDEQATLEDTRKFLRDAGATDVDLLTADAEELTSSTHLVDGDRRPADFGSDSSRLGRALPVCSLVEAANPQFLRHGSAASVQSPDCFPLVCGRTFLPFAGRRHGRSRSVAPRHRIPGGHRAGDERGGSNLAGVDPRRDERESSWHPRKRSRETSPELDETPTDAERRTGDDASESPESEADASDDADAVPEENSELVRQCNGDNGRY